MIISDRDTTALNITIASKIICFVLDGFLNYDYSFLRDSRNSLIGRFLNGRHGLLMNGQNPRTLFHPSFRAVRLLYSPF